MCGINGFNWADKKIVVSMNNKIKHRGPDDSGIFVSEKISLGHVRLSILDLSIAGHQPMFYSKEKGGCSEKYKKSNLENSSISIVFNGEIYNFKEIKKELENKGYIFSTKTDTEVILASYLEWGQDCVKRFNGMWGFCIYDLKKNILFLSRDRIGVKPLYYYFNRGKFIFSSEIKGILETGIKVIPDEKTIFDFLYYNFRDHEEETFFENIGKINPGENLVFFIDNKKIIKNKYYNLKEEIKKVKEENFKEILFDSVKRRMVSDVRVDATLSGGIDSSGVVCLMKENNPKENFLVFSLVFPNHKIDESKFQKIIEEKTKVKRFTTTFNCKDIIKDLNDFVYLHEEPLKSLSQYAQYKVMQLAKKNKSKVLLEGQGADEILAGYEWFYGHLLKELFIKLRWKKFIKEVVCFKKRYGNFKIMSYFFAAISPTGISSFLWKKRMNHINLKYFSQFKNRKTKLIQWEAKTLNELCFVAETYSTLPELLIYGDKNSMRWGVESRVPFCDHNLVECVLRMPAKDKINLGETKVVLRESMKGILPEEIRKRKDKIGFATPDKELLLNPTFKKMMEKMFRDNDFKKIPYWNCKELERRYEEHLKGKKDNSRELLKIFLFFKWWGMFIKDKNLYTEKFYN